MTKGSVLTFAIVALTASAGWRAATLLSATPASADSRYIDAEPGKRVETKIQKIQGSSGEAMALSDVEPGSCRLVLVVSPSCGASRASAKAWRYAQLANPSIPEVPDSWRVLWVSLGDKMSTDSAFGNDLPDKVWTVLSPETLIAELGLRAVPVHLVLDRSGAVVTSDVGASLLPLEAYRDDCSLAERPDG